MTAIDFTEDMQKMAGLCDKASRAALNEIFEIAKAAAADDCEDFVLTALSVAICKVLSAVAASSGMSLDQREAYYHAATTEIQNNLMASLMVGARLPGVSQEGRA